MPGLKEEPFPLDWDVWRQKWRQWRFANEERLKPVLGRSLFSGAGKNFAADAVLGVFRLTDEVQVELSEVTMPDFGRARHADPIRYVGITFASKRRGRWVPDRGIVRTFAELEEELWGQELVP